MSETFFAPPPPQGQARRAWVVFSGRCDLFWLRFLRPGFRHCFIVLHDGAHWITLDPLSNFTELSVHDLPESFDLPGWLARRGHRVVKAEIRRDLPRPAPFMVFTCVEAVKRVLGIHRFFILTPWQLYRHLESKNKARNAAAFSTSSPSPSERRTAWQL